MEVVYVGRDDAPIATIVHKSGAYWHLVPEDPTEPMPTTEMPALMRYGIFKESYGEAHRVKLPRWKKLASGDDCEISGMVMDWAGVEIDWDGHAYWGNFSFENHLFDRCKHLDYDCEEWSGSAPGLSGI